MHNEYDDNPLKEVLDRGLTQEARERGYEVERTSEEIVLETVVNLVKGYITQPDELRSEIRSAGYRRVNVVLEPAQVDYGILIGEKKATYELLEILVACVGETQGLEARILVPRRNALEERVYPPDLVMDRDWEITQLDPYVKPFLRAVGKMHWQVLIMKTKDPFTSRFNVAEFIPKKKDPETGKFNPDEEETFAGAYTIILRLIAKTQGHILILDRGLKL